MGGLAVDGAGTSFYRFKDISDTKAFIQTWYSILNGLNLSEAQKKAVVEEANVVFRLNIDVFEELDGSPITAAWQLFVSSLQERFGLTAFALTLCQQWSCAPDVSLLVRVMCVPNLGNGPCAFMHRGWDIRPPGLAIHAVQTHEADLTQRCARLASQITHAS